MVRIVRLDWISNKGSFVRVKTITELRKFIWAGGIYRDRRVLRLEEITEIRRFVRLGESKYGQMVRVLRLGGDSNDRQVVNLETDSSDVEGGEARG